MHCVYATGAVQWAQYIELALYSHYRLTNQRRASTDLWSVEL